MDWVAHQRVETYPVPAEVEQLHRWPTSVGGQARHVLRPSKLIQVRYGSDEI